MENRLSSGLSCKHMKRQRRDLGHHSACLTLYIFVCMCMFLNVGLFTETFSVLLFKGVHVYLFIDHVSCVYDRTCVQIPKGPVQAIVLSTEC